MNETEGGLAIKEEIKKEVTKKEKKPDFATLIFEEGKEIYCEDPDKTNRRGRHAIKGVIPKGATIQVRVNFARPGDFLACAVLKINDIPNRETRFLNVGVDEDWVIKKPIKTKKRLEIQSWVFANKYSLRNRQRRLREAKKTGFKQPSLSKEVFSKKKIS